MSRRSSQVLIYTVEPLYNEVLGTMKITLLYQVSHYIRVKKTKKYKELGPAKLPRYNVISDLVIMRFHCTNTYTNISAYCIQSGCIEAGISDNFPVYALLENFIL